MTPIVEAFKALIPPLMTVHDGQVAVSATNEIPKPPWAFLRFPNPDGLERSLTGDRHGGLVEGELLVYHTLMAPLRLMATDLDRALDGARLSVPGYQFGRITISGITPPAQDRDVKYSGAHPLVISLEFSFTVFPMEA